MTESDKIAQLMARTGWTAYRDHRGCVDAITSLGWVSGCTAAQLEHQYSKLQEAYWHWMLKPNTWYSPQIPWVSVRRP